MRRRPAPEDREAEAETARIADEPSVEPVTLADEPTVGPATLADEPLVVPCALVDDPSAPPGVLSTARAKPADPVRVSDGVILRVTPLASDPAAAPTRSRGAVSEGAKAHSSLASTGAGGAAGRPPRPRRRAAGETESGDR